MSSIYSYITDIYTQGPSSLSEEEIKGLYTYNVPLLSPDGGCALNKELADEPYDLAETLHVDRHSATIGSHPETKRLWRLQQVIDHIYAQTGVDWIGIYRRIQKNDGSVVLAKEAYRGEYSRAEFPLTEEFAKTSNNATVGLTGKAITVQSVDEYDGPYYQCDGKVQSEYCAPIFNPENQITGIIDAESFHKGYFNEGILSAITETCDVIGRIDVQYAAPLSSEN